MRYIIILVLLFTLAGCGEGGGIASPPTGGDTQLYALTSRIGMVVVVDDHGIAWVRMQPDEVLALQTHEGMRDLIERNRLCGVRTFVDVGYDGERHYIIEEVTSQFPSEW